MDRPSAHHRGYGARWRKARVAFLAAHPLCAYCLDAGRTTAASVVDHVQPHRGDPRLFWDAANWQALCQPCHDRHKAKLERSGSLPGCDASGVPLDPAHPWRRGAGVGDIAGADRPETVRQLVSR